MMQSPKHCKMAADVADNSLPLEPNQSKKRRCAHLSEGERNVKKKNVIPGNTQRENSNAAITWEDQAFEKFSSLFIFITYAEVEGAIMEILMEILFTVLTIYNNTYIHT